LGTLSGGLVSVSTPYPDAQSLSPSDQAHLYNLRKENLTYLRLCAFEIAQFVKQFTSLTFYNFYNFEVAGRKLYSLFD